MPRPKAVGYSDLVLEGLEFLGYSRDQIAQAAKVSRPFLNDVAEGKREFTTAQIFRVEDLADKTGGQLAALIMEPNGGPLTDLSNEWGEFRKLLKRSKQPKRRRTPRRATVSTHKT